jgi:hypothetical protein
MMVYGWTIILFSYRLTGWLYSLNIDEILNILAYSISVNLLESLVVLAGVVVLGAALPKKLFRDVFVSSGASLSILALGLMMYTASQFNTKEYYPAEIIRWSPIILAGIALVTFTISRVKFLRRSIEWFADRATIFLYISIPLSLACLIVVLAQVLF